MQRNRLHGQLNLKYTSVHLDACLEGGFLVLQLPAMAVLVAKLCQEECVLALQVVHVLLQAVQPQLQHCATAFPLLHVQLCC